ncbi:hypothetical protein CsSME_00035920 [Camellia sinensis var. sinensis]
MAINVDKFSSFMKHGIVGNEDSRLIITRHAQWSGNRKAKILEKRLNPEHFRSNMSHGMVLSLGTRTSNNSLFLTAPSSKFTTNKGTIAGGGMVVSLITSLISITKAGDRQRERGATEQTPTGGTLQVLQDMTNNSKVRLAGSMHKLTNHSYDIRNIGMSDSDID